MRVDFRQRFPSAWPSMLAGMLALAGCNQRHWVCEPPDPQALSRLPQRLSETGLYAQLESETLAPDVYAYRPQFELWSDGATKRRWLFLPAGTQIDTSDMDRWLFPEGTKLFNAVAPVAPARKRKVAQLSSTAAVWFVLHEQVSLAVEFVAPIAGPLARWNYAGGLSLATGW